jgi:hypothetical protein
VKGLVLFSVIVLTVGTSFGQNRVEAYITPAIGFRFLEQGSLGTDELTDSLQIADNVRQNWSAGAKLHIGLNKYSALQLGVNFKGVSFTRVRKDYQFHDTVHPEIGRVIDLSQTVLTKDAYFYHKYRYISIPVIYQTAFTKTLVNNKMQFYFAGGLDFDFLLRDKTAVSLVGWSVGGDDRFIISNDYESTKANVALNLGARFEYKIDEYATFCLQPALNYPLLLSAKDDFVQFRMYQFGLSVGVSYLL